MEKKHLKIFLLKYEDQKKREKTIKVYADSSDEAVIYVGLLYKCRLFEVVELKGIEAFSERLFLGKSKSIEILKIFPKISQLLKIGTSLDKALLMQVGSVKGKLTQYNMLKVVEKIRLGSSISEAFGGILPVEAISVLKAGEVSDEIGLALLRLGKSAIKREVFFKKMVSELIYPGIVLVSSILVVTIFTIFFIPQLVEIYDSFDAQLPVITVVLSKVSQFVLNNPAFWVFPGALFIMAIKLLPKLVRSELFSRVVYHLPGLGKFLRKKDIAQSMECFTMLIRGGISIHDALDTASNAGSNYHNRRLFQNVRSSIKKGLSLSEAFAENLDSPELGQEIVNAVQIGEHIAEVENVLQDLVTELQENLDYQVNNFSKVIGPTMTLLLAAVGAFVVVTIMYPLAKLTTAFTTSFGGVL